ncbi:MAG: HDOD domain-containing protein [candidate division Zixibacteria bacterium]|nr:HDOD domain-containing protein [candidate division Zixibacteria bacterium]
MITQFVQDVLDDNPQLSSLPQTMVEVLRVARDEKASTRDLAEVLQHDPSMTAKVLRMVNSPYYGMMREIGSVRQAVQTIGMRQVMALALTSSVYRMTDNWNSCLDRVRFWRHSLEVAIAARMIAEKAGYRHSEEAFVAGLLHDLGLLILEHAVPDRFSQVWKQAEREGNLPELEIEAWGTNHALIGQYLLERWNLPDTISRAVGRHHSTFLPGTANQELCTSQIVCLAHLISKFAVSSEHALNSDLLVNKEVLRRNLNIPTGEILAIEKTLFSMTLEEAAYLEIDVGSVDEIMLEANRMLFDQYVTIENLLREIRDLRHRDKWDNIIN